LKTIILISAEDGVRKSIIRRYKTANGKKSVWNRSSSIKKEAAILQRANSLSGLINLSATYTVIRGEAIPATVDIDRIIPAIVPVMPGIPLR